MNPHLLELLTWVKNQDIRAALSPEASMQGKNAADDKLIFLNSNSIVLCSLTEKGKKLLTSVIGTPSKCVDNTTVTDESIEIGDLVSVTGYPEEWDRATVENIYEPHNGGDLIVSVINAAGQLTYVPIGLLRYPEQASTGVDGKINFTAINLGEINGQRTMELIVSYSSEHTGQELPPLRLTPDTFLEMIQVLHKLYDTWPKDTKPKS